MSARRALRLVRYVSPFGSPAWISREEAAIHLERDDRRYLDLAEAGALSDAMRRVGPPRIEHDRGAGR